MPEHGPVPWDNLQGVSGPAEYWTTGNIGEALPGVMTPLSWSLWAPAIEAGTRAAFHALGAARAEEVDLPADPGNRFIQAFYGRGAVNVRFMCQMGDRIPGTSGAAICEQILGFVPENLRGEQTRARYPVIAGRMPWTFLRTPKILIAAGRETEQWWAQEAGRAASMSVEQARVLFTDANRRFARNLRLQPTILFSAIQPVYESMGRLVGSTGVGDLTTLTSGYGAVPETLVVTDLWQSARGKLDMAEVVRRHGFHGPREGELSSRVWREDDTPLRRLVGDYEKAHDSESPLLREQGLKAARVEMERKILASLKPGKRPGARFLLRTATRLIPLRGVAKIGFMQAFDVLRASSRRIGELLAAADGTLESADDIFYLTADEVFGALPRDVHGLVKKRRERRDQYLNYDLPPLWQGMPAPIDLATAADDATDLTGLGVSPGVVEGRARVITDPATTDFDAGDILVSSTTDPSWASIMFVSGALVADIGGVLSHTAMVARELGVPCVVNATNASRTIRDGDTIRVDGTTGIVTILKRSDA
jgi:pyruvate,water dikinase